MNSLQRAAPGERVPSRGFAGQQPGGVVREELAAGGAFLHLGDAVAERLAHFARHQVREALRLRPQDLRD